MEQLEAEVVCLVLILFGDILLPFVARRVLRETEKKKKKKPACYYVPAFSSLFCMCLL
jgi:hypothetical protein